MAEKLPLVAAALPFVGHFQTRNKGTVCGSIAHADPSSELPLALAVLGGEVVLRSAAANACSPASEFQQDMLTTAREPDELIVAVRFPVRPHAAPLSRSGAPPRRLRHRRGAAVAIDDGAVRVGVGGMAGRPMVRRFDGDAAPRSANGPKSSKATRICMPRPALRRDLFSKLGPHVIAEAKRCAA